MKRESQTTHPALDQRRAEHREAALRWLATSQAEREMAERLALHRELAGLKR